MDRQMLDYLPRVLQIVRDFQCLMAVYQSAFRDLWQRERENEDNFYLQTAGEQGLRHWERILGIPNRPGLDLEARRQIIAAQISKTPPYCWNTLLFVLRTLTGSEEAFYAELDGFVLKLDLKAPWRKMEDAVFHLVRQMIPANIALYIVLSGNTHRDLSRATHRAHSAYTHYQLRNEVDFT